MIRRDAAALRVAGPVRLDTVAPLFEAGCSEIRAGAEAVDLSEVTELDSSLLALLVAWRREALRLGRDLRIQAAPEALVTLARLYGVEALLPVASTRP